MSNSLKTSRTNIKGEIVGKCKKKKIQQYKKFKKVNSKKNKKGERVKKEK